ncbi:lysophospholipid acyltransferase family protein [Sciscionella sediminilitoris]|uniref:lysophospholipid acyltransferase family protein n=1 Tax=Sciscionella sediminilitoris TaxID=1445613 RepID=UPI0004DF97E0|nr:lysophospholipid acyltransferase family protein [Sciscionella sp. SE31]
MVNPLWLNLARSVFYPVTTGLAKTEVIDGAKLPRTGGAILVLNHITHIDPLYDSVIVDKLGRRPHFLAKHSLFEKPLAKQVLYGTGQIPVYRGTDKAVDSLAEARSMLADGALVIIYPEGTCTKDPLGWPMISRSGVARLALDTDVPVIPAARWGTLSIMNLYEKRFSPLPRSKVSVKFGDPLDLSAERAAGVSGRNLLAVTDTAMRAVRDLVGELRGETPPEEFYNPRKEKNKAKNKANPDA